MVPVATLLAGRFKLDKPIGSGGFCDVWRATDTVLSRPVAVKLLHPGYADQAEALGRFKAEARHAGSLSHPNIARVYDYGEPAGGQPPYLVMELVDGPSLAGVLAGGPLGAARTMDVVAQAAAGLQAAHAGGLVHRDVKPGNILFAPGGMVRITDFGIAHAIGSAPVTASGIVMGTPGYIAPERVSGGPAAPASDLYALGIVAYECLAGAPPFTGAALEVATAHRDCPLPALPASVPAEVVAFVMTLTAKDPACRPGSAAEVADRAARLRDDLRSRRDATRLIPAEPVRTGQRRRRAGIGVAALAVAALVGLMLASMTGFASAQHPANGSSPAPSSAGQSAGRPSSASPGTSAPPGHGHKQRHRHGNDQGNQDGD
jgi:eukaryotic-like serine/threonine-protein kinase